MRRRVFTICFNCKNRFKRETYMQRLCPVCKEIRLIENKKKVYPPSPTKILQQKVFKRDEFTCRICRTNKNLNMHHWDKDHGNSKSNNLITLCNICHMGLHAFYRKRGIK